MDAPNVAAQPSPVNLESPEPVVGESLRRLAEAAERQAAAHAEIAADIHRLALLAAPLLASLSPDAPPIQYATLSQAALLVHRSVETLRKLKARMPPPAVSGGGRGTPDEWEWSELRPWLERHFDRSLPERLPAFSE